MRREPFFTCCLCRSLGGNLKCETGIERLHAFLFIKMKQIFYKTLLICLFACIGQTVSADEVEGDNTEEIEGTEDAGDTVEFEDSIFVYKITDAEKGEVSVVAGWCPEIEIEIDEDTYITTSTEITIPSSVSYKGKDYSVTGIGYKAFTEAYELTSVTIPNSVTKIGKNAFYGLSKLEAVNFSNNELTDIGDNPFGGTPWYENQSGLVYFGATLYEYKGDMPSNTSLTIKEGTKIIYDGAFSNCDSLVSINIPEGVTYIGGGAFSNCDKLSSISIPNGVTMINESTFYNCYSLKSINIPDGVTSIGNDAFEWCLELTSVTIPESVTSIGIDAFRGCEKITSVDIPKGVTYIGGGAFDNCDKLSSISIPNGVTMINASTFSNCYSLRAINIPEGVTSIGEDAFYNSGITSITIPNSVTYIGESAFHCCQSLKSVILSKNLKGIEDHCFNGTAITSIIIPEGVAYIGEGAFYHSSLETVTIPSSVTRIGWAAFHATPWFNNMPDGAIYLAKFLYNYKETTTSDESAMAKVKTMADSYNATELANVIVKDGTTYVCAGAFANCERVISVTLPNSVQVVDSAAFYNCKGLETINMSGDLKTIGYMAFAYCKGLTSITIPQNVASIGIGAFLSDANLKTIYMCPTFPPTCGWNCIIPELLASDYVIYVPKDSYSDYQNSDWSKYNIQPMDLSNIDNIKIGDSNVNADAYYSIGGQRMAKSCKGINIIKYSDGSTRKVYRKN